MLAKHALSQLSYGPGELYLMLLARRFDEVVGLGGLEPPTSRLSSARSNQLSYKPLANSPGQSKVMLQPSGLGSSMKKEKRRRRRPA